MSNTPKTSDRDAFETLIRSGQRKNKVNWIMRGDRQDVDDLNAAIRKASGRGEPEPGGEPYPWTSLKDGVGDESEGA
jgi:hypothetical protein